MEAVGWALTYWLCSCLFCNHPQHLPPNPLVTPKLWGSQLDSYPLTSWDPTPMTVGQLVEKEPQDQGGGGQEVRESYDTAIRA